MFHMNSFELLRGDCQTETTDIDRRCRMATLLIRTAVVNAVAKLEPGPRHTLIVLLGDQLKTKEEVKHYLDNHRFGVVDGGLPAVRDFNLRFDLGEPVCALADFTHSRVIELLPGYTAE